jgi:hypothetical protein
MGAKADCYRLIQEIAIGQDPFCRAPGCGKRTDCGHHIFKRDRLATAFEPDAVIGLCTQHHTGFAHGKPEEFKKFMIKRLGEARYYELRRLSHTDVPFMDYEKKRDELKRILEEIRGDIP